MAMYTLFWMKHVEGSYTLGLDYVSGLKCRNYQHWVHYLPPANTVNETHKKRQLLVLTMVRDKRISL